MPPRPPSPRARTWSRFRRAAKAAPGGYGGGYGPGPVWADAYRSRRGPSAQELVEAWKSCVFFLSGFNSKAVAATSLRLYVATKDGQPRPKSYLGAKPVTRWMKGWIKRRGYLAKDLAGAAEIEEVTGEHPILDAMRDCNPFMDFGQLLALTVTSMDVIGTSYWQPTIVTAGGRKYPEELWALPAQAIWPVPSGTSLVPSGYQYFAKTYDPSELIRFVGVCSLRNPYMDGMSPARAAVAYARIEDEFISDQDGNNSNGPRPKILVTTKDPNGSIGKPERVRLRQEFNAVGARGNLGGIAIADGNLRVNPITYQNIDPGVTVLSDYALERMANALDIPPPFYSKETNLANLQAAKAFHAEYGVDPRCKNIEATLTRYFRALDPGDRQGWSRLSFVFDPVIEDDKTAAAEQHKTYFPMGVMTPNQIATEIGYEAFDGGDARFVPGTLKTIDQVVNPPKPEPVFPNGQSDGEFDAGAKALVTPGGEHRHRFRPSPWDKVIWPGA